VLQDHHLIEKMTTFKRDASRTRATHQGQRDFGSFHFTNDARVFTKAAVFQSTPQPGR
jgi:catalase